VPLSDLLRQAMARTRTWTAAAADVERERTRQVARIGSNLNQLARWAQPPCLGDRCRRGDRQPRASAETAAMHIKRKFQRPILRNWLFLKGLSRFWRGFMLDL